MKKKYNVYDKEFKVSACKLVLEQGKKQVDVAKDLGVSNKTLSGWIKSYQAQQGNDKDLFVGSGNLKEEDKALKEMEKRLRDLEEENAILKKAMGIFAKSQK